MSVDEPLMLRIDYPARHDRRTHIERICPLPNGESPAWLPDAARWHAPGIRPDLEPRRHAPRGDPRRYIVLADSFAQSDVWVPSGHAVSLHEEHAGLQYQVVEEAEGA